MRCECCNRVLSDYESTLKSLNTGEYLNTCSRCLDGLGIEVVGNDDLNDELVEDNGDGSEEDGSEEVEY